METMSVTIQLANKLRITQWSIERLEITLRYRIRRRMGVKDILSAIVNSKWI